MPVTIVAGAQWGDEGKGRIVDLLSADADMVVRCQGGPNAGHTVVNDRGRFILHSVPSGVLRDQVRCVIGAGTVISPTGLAAEMRGLADAGVTVDHLLISERAHLILPYHVVFERIDEQDRQAARRIGPTGQGIAPAYADKAARRGLRAGDLLDMDGFKARLAEELSLRNRLLAAYGEPPITEKQVLAEMEPAAEFLRPFIGDTVAPIAEALSAGKRILLEGQLGVMRDLDWGAYPFVTSSSPTPAGMAAGAGIPPMAVDRVIGVVKAYTTAVGAGPFPTELDGADADALRESGDEYGATTRRPRRVGWFDAVAVAWAARVAGFSEIALTKIDVLDGRAGVPICTAYRSQDAVLGSFPTTDLMQTVEPVYSMMPGWSGTAGARRITDLPSEARAYIDEIERLVGVPIALVSTSAERESMIARSR